jgi:hypothetical protein
MVSRESVIAIELIECVEVVVTAVRKTSVSEKHQRYPPLTARIVELSFEFKF